MISATERDVAPLFLKDGRKSGIHNSVKATFMGHSFRDPVEDQNALILAGHGESKDLMLKVIDDADGMRLVAHG